MCSPSGQGRPSPENLLGHYLISSRSFHFMRKQFPPFLFSLVSLGRSSPFDLKFFPLFSKTSSQIPLSYFFETSCSTSTSSSPPPPARLSPLRRIAGTLPPLPCNSPPALLPHQQTRTLSLSSRYVRALPLHEQSCDDTEAYTWTSQASQEQMQLRGGGGGGLCCGM